MKKIECIIRPTKLDKVNEALSKFGINGMTVTQVMGCGLQRGRRETYRGTSYDINLLPKIKIEIVIPDRWLDSVVNTIKENAFSGEIGDGKIFILPVENAIRIRTSEQGDEAL